ncbi:TFIIB-type zinc ribbon-containing protein [Salipiger sp. P9]|uniref:TFIIB-type zinc ribbon-containing protein n=1 Tax=Salipiger pentaromativorans TaxID=2943193 RepID=UPI0021586A68|nr:TFIIB-type zinc ribbon-containing protein [Salipiger pentaromativorans]MCR8549843.1 TFIIB-type zinc ribbon-containing protein [Salipiger pentaromativorans]
MPNTKIATCSYCGSRAALVLDAGRHELVCASCGAPLHELKQLRSAAVNRNAPRHRPAPFSEDRTKREKAQRKAKKKKKSLGKKAAKGLFDLLDDIFD